MMLYGPYEPNPNSCKYLKEQILRSAVIVASGPTGLLSRFNQPAAGEHHAKG